MRKWSRSVPSAPKSARFVVPNVETLEDRLTPTTWTVLNGNAAGVGSLAAAVADANNDTSPALIIFDATYFSTPRTIALTSTLSFSNTNQPIIVEGLTAATITISGGGGVQIVNVSAGVTATLRNLTLTQGNAGTQYGGAIGMLGDMLTVDRCTISNSSAYSGGGIQVQAGNVLLRDSTITGNVTPVTGYGKGGGLNVAGGNVTVLGCTFSQNTSNGINGGEGGAIYATNGVLSVVNSTFSGNAVESYGAVAGAVRLFRATATFVNCTFSGNSAPSVGGNVGGILAGLSPTTLINDLVWGNTAGLGRDLAADNHATSVIDTSLFGEANEGNTPDFSGVGDLLDVSAGLSLIGPLSNNGGSTQTRAPVANSLPIGAGGSVARSIGQTTASETEILVSGSSFSAGVLPTLTSGAYHVIQVGGEQLAVTGVSATGISLAAVIPVGGTGYQVGDVLTTQPGPGEPATFIVTAVGISGSISALTASDSGFFSNIVFPTLSIGFTGGHGTGAVGNPSYSTASRLVVRRGANATTAAAHPSNEPVFLMSDQRGALAPYSTSPSADIGSVNRGGSGLAFYVQPPVATSSNSNFDVSVVDANGGTPVAGAEITISISSGSLIGTATATTDAFGVAVFSNLSVPVAGTFTLTATIGALHATSNPFTVDDSTATTLVSMNRQSSDVSGGGSVIIQGTNFTGATEVFFGGVAATSFTVDSDRQLTAIVPAQSAGAVDVSVTSPQGTSPVSAGARFDYVSEATFLVTNTASSGSGSLFAALQRANAATSPAIITFDPSVFDVARTITLPASLVFQNPKQPITVLGPTASTLTISGNSQSGSLTRVAIVRAGVTATLRNLRLTQGNAKYFYGGGVSILSGTVTIDSCTIENCTADSGGGIGITGGTAVVRNSFIVGNTAQGNFGGGGLISFFDSDLTVLNSTVSNNASLNGKSGGAMALRGKRGATIVNSTFNGNTAAGGGEGGDGGAIWATIQGVTIVNSTLTGNTATASGGAIHASSGLTLVNDIVWKNTAVTEPDIGFLGHDGSLIHLDHTLSSHTNWVPGDALGNFLNVSSNLPMLGPWSNNGGPTLTMMPSADGYPVGAAGNVTVLEAPLGQTAVTFLTAKDCFGARLPALASGSYYSIQIGGEQMEVSALTSVSLLNGFGFHSGGSGSNYQVGDVLTVDGGIGTPATLRVTSVYSDGGINEIAIVNPGVYSTIPSVFFSTVTGGHGAGFSFRMYFSAAKQLTVVRGANGTQPAAHAADSPVYLVSDQRGRLTPYRDTPISDMGAVNSGAIGGSGLAFYTQPNDTTTNSAFKFGVVLTSGGSPVAGAVVTIDLISGSFAGSTTATTNGYGVAVFDVSVPVAGTYTLTATAGALQATSQSFTIGDHVVPVVGSISQPSGDVAGGETVLITGTNFTDATAVLFGVTPATSFTVDSSTQITAVAPSRPAGTTAVRVATPQGTSAVSAGGQYTHVAAVEFVVTNSSAWGAGSLANALRKARVATSPVTITFSPTVFNVPQTITLTASLVVDNPRAPITIEGPTAATLTISGNRQGGEHVQNVIFEGGGRATIQNLTITQGYDGPGVGVGGGVVIISGTVTIDRCTISDNVSDGGGGIVVHAGKLLLQNSSILGNTANGPGGGLLVGGNNQVSAWVTVVSCLFAQNLSYGTNDGNGGGISSYNPIGALTVVNSTFTANTAAGGAYGRGIGGHGGGIAVNHGQFTLVNSTITGNSGPSAESGVGGHGGVWMSHLATPTLLNNVFWNNAGDYVNDLTTNNDKFTANYLLIGDPTGTSLPSAAIGNILNVPTNPPILGSLGSNGGATQTLAPVAGSPSVGAGGAVTALGLAVADVASESIAVVNARVFAATSLSQIAFAATPTSGDVGAPLSPLKVKIINDSPYKQFVRIDGETMQVTGVIVNDNGSGTLFVLRGANGSAAASHAANAPVFLVSDQRGFVRPSGSGTPVVDMGSVQSTAAVPVASSGNSLSPIKITVAASSGTLNGTLTVVTDATGTATFDNVKAPTTGTFNLVATTGSSTATSTSFAVIVGPPVLAALTPNSGSVVGGTSVVITGSFFVGVTSVKFGNVPAASYTVNSPTQITAVSPAGALGTVDVVVSTSLGTTPQSSGDVFTYALSPVVTSLSPTFGVTAGGTTVVVAGVNFDFATAVFFGSVAAPSFAVNSSTQITAVAPAHLTGIVDVTVRAPSGTSPTSAIARFTYQDSPQVSAVAPFVGPTVGGATVVITGVNFVDVEAVRFGASNALSFTVNSATRITVLSPAGQTGLVDVTVETAYGTSSGIGAENDYSYVAPQITSVVVNGGDIIARNKYGRTPALLGQQSIVAQLLVTFNMPVTLDPGAFNLQGIASPGLIGGAPSSATVAIAATGVPSTQSPAGFTQFVLTFNAGPGVSSFDNGAGGNGNAFTTLQNGLFQFNAVGSRIHADSATLSHHSEMVWSLFGAVNPQDVKVSLPVSDGNDTLFVDGIALSDLYRTFGSRDAFSSSLPYSTPYDWNLDGDVDGLDLSQFYSNFGTIWRL